MKPFPTRLLALLLLMMPLCPGFAEGTDAPFLRHETKQNAVESLSSGEVHALVEAMFAAAAGVAEADETALWKALGTREARDARSAENAAYRARTLPWLLLACAPEESVHRDENAACLIEAGMEALRGNPQGQALLDRLRALGGTDGPGCTSVMRAAFQRWLAEIDPARLSGINPDYQGWLYAPGTPVDYPVVQGRDNSYYLSHLFDGTVNKAGTLFMDWRNLPGFRDPNTLIYGHHMRIDAMFHRLPEYAEPGYFDAHPFLLAVSADAVDVVEVFAAYVTDGSDPCYDIAISGETDMRRFVTAAAEKSAFASHVEIDCTRDHLLTLSTCAYDFPGARYIVIGRLRRAGTIPPCR